MKLAHFIADFLGCVVLGGWLAAAFCLPFVLIYLAAKLLGVL